MKKGLSILLVAAAIFGFYGSAVNINDVLACKDYWEEAGEKSTADMNKLEDGLNQLKDNEQAYLDGQEQLAEGEQALADGEAKLAAGEAQYAKGLSDYKAAPAKLAAARKAIAKGEKDLSNGKKTLSSAKKLLKKLKDGVKKLSDKDKGYPAWKAGFDKACETAPDTVEALSTDGSLDSDKIQAMLDQTEKQKESLDSAVSALDGLDQVIAGIKDAVPKAYRDAEAAAIDCPQALAYIASQLGASALLPSGKQTANTWIGVAKTLQQNVIKKVATNAGDPDMKQINSAAAVKALQKKAADGIESLNDLQKLVAGKKEIQDQLLPLLDQKAIKKNKVVKKKLGDVNKIINGLKGDDKTFEKTMDKIMKAAPGLVAAVEKAVKSGEKELNAGKKKLANGKKQYAAGLASYNSAPAQLADARQQLADGRAQLEDGRQQLEDGRAQLAQYEDGEQQVRDGLATLVGTEPDLDLVGILDRLDGDGDFDNGDNHLDIDEGLNAVEVGRGYQADDGVLITKEIMARAVGTGALLGAGVFAILAAILSFLKKNKGAGVCALLAAVAGAFGAFYGTNAGTYFSDIAGSTVGSTAWIAAGTLGAVALVHAIVHFASKKAVV